MIKKIVEGYGNLFSSVVKIFLLLFVCGIIGGIIVLPLWKFATSAPEIYTIFIFAILALSFIILCAKKIKNDGIKNFLIILSKIIVILGGLSICIILVLNGKRFLSIPTFIFMIGIYGIISFGLKKSNKQQKNEL